MISIRFREVGAVAESASTDFSSSLSEKRKNFLIFDLTLRVAVLYLRDFSDKLRTCGEMMLSHDKDRLHFVALLVLPEL